MLRRLRRFLFRLALGSFLPGILLGCIGKKGGLMRKAGSALMFIAVAAFILFLFLSIFSMVSFMFKIFFSLLLLIIVFVVIGIFIGKRK